MKKTILKNIAFTFIIVHVAFIIMSYAIGQNKLLLAHPNFNSAIGNPITAYVLELVGMIVIAIINSLINEKVYENKNLNLASKTSLGFVLTLITVLTFLFIFRIINSAQEAIYNTIIFSVIYFAIWYSFYIYNKKINQKLKEKNQSWQFLFMNKL